MTEQLPFPARWDEGATVSTNDGRKLRRWGSVKEAGRMLWGYGDDTIYQLLHAGTIKGVRRPGRNTKWRVDLVSVWEYKVKVEGGRMKDEVGRS
jgi:hypothetical protein